LNVAHIHSRIPVIEQCVILVLPRSLNAIFFLPLRLPPPAPQTPPQQTVKQWLDAVNRSVFNQQKSPSLPTLPSASLQHTLLLSTARPFIQSRYAAITMNTPPASSATLAPEQPPAPQPRAINFATEWLDEDGRVCPKNVDYATQCPKGHDLVSVSLGGGGGAEAQQASGANVMCRVCHASTPQQHACEWLVCSVAGCCGGYAVCAACACALDRADAADAGSEDFPLEVRGTQAALLLHMRLRRV
jgi:hypothetical protein